MMTQTAVSPNPEEILNTDFAKELVKQMRALDSYGLYDQWGPDKILDPFILTKERKREIPVVGDPDDVTMSRVKAFYNALSCLIEKERGLMAVPMINLSHEGFGRALITTGKLIVIDKTLRDVHRFGFPSLSKMKDEVDKLLSNAYKLMDEYPQVAEL